MINVTPIPAFRDNYLWLITQGQHAVIVDPGDDQVVIEYLEKHQLTLVGILVTHHHSDHTGGIEVLKSRYNATVWGPKHDPVKHLDYACDEGDKIIIPELSLDSEAIVEFQVIAVPGHTLGHIVYFLPQSNANNHHRLFCGDTVFSGGCGRLFEGTPEQMLTSINKIKQLPKDTLLYPAHEYTLDNLTFAKAVEPDNQALSQYVTQVESLRSQDKPSLPTSLSNELAINPFMRCEQAGIIDTAKEITHNHGEASHTRITDDQLSEIDIFTIIRRYKDNF